MKTLPLFLVSVVMFGCSDMGVDPRPPTKSFLNTTWESQSTSRVIIRSDSIVVYERSTSGGGYGQWRRNAWQITSYTMSADSLTLNMGVTWAIIAYRDGASMWIAIWKNAPGIYRQYF